MKEWAVYAIVAAIAYGLSAIILKLAVGKGGIAAMPEAVLIVSCACSLAGAIGYFIISGKTAVIAVGMDRNTIVMSGISGLISIIGSLFVIRALSIPSTSVSSVMSLVSTNVLFTLLFSIILIEQVPEGMSLTRTVFGSVLVFAGAFVLCK